MQEPFLLLQHTATCACLELIETVLKNVHGTTIVLKTLSAGSPQEKDSTSKLGNQPKELNIGLGRVQSTEGCELVNTKSPRLSVKDRD